MKQAMQTFADMEIGDVFETEGYALLMKTIKCVETETGGEVNCIDLRLGEMVFCEDDETVTKRTTAKVVIE